MNAVKNPSCFARPQEDRHVLENRLHLTEFPWIADLCGIRRLQKEPKGVFSRLLELAALRPRFGYKRLHVLPRRGEADCAEEAQKAGLRESTGGDADT
jgi:hypothetical protein